MPSSRAVLLLLLALPLAGCPLFFDPDSVALRDDGGPPAEDMPTDAADPGDMPTDTRMDMADVADLSGDMRDMREMPDARDMAVDDAADMPLDAGPHGQPCPGEHPELDGNCMLVTQRPCGEGEVCEVVLVGGEPSRQCRAENDGETYELTEGATCDPGSSENCLPHLFCRAGFCVRYCDLADGFGCEPGQFCAPHEPDGLFAGLGYCTATCP